MKLPALYVKLFLVYSEKSAIGETEHFILIFIQNDFLNTSSML